MGHRRGMVVVVLGFVGLSCVKFMGLGFVDMGMMGGFFLVVVWVGLTFLVVVVIVVTVVAGGSGSGCGFEFVIGFEIVIWF